MGPWQDRAPTTGPKHKKRPDTSRRPVTADRRTAHMHGGRDVANDASTVFDLVILGGGSGGYAAALRACQPAEFAYGSLVL